MGPNIEPCGTPNEMLNKSLKDEPIRNTDSSISVVTQEES